MQRLKQQPAEGSAFLAGTSSHTRARQHQDGGRSHASSPCCAEHIFRLVLLAICDAEHCIKPVTGLLASVMLSTASDLSLVELGTCMLLYKLHKMVHYKQSLSVLVKQDKHI